MWWLTLRLQRAELILLLMCALALGVAYATTQDDIHNLAPEARYVGLDLACGAPFSYFGDPDYCPNGTGSLLPLLNEGLPYVFLLPLGLAIVMTFPLVMELSSRSYRLAWVQSDTRATWARSRLVLILTTCLVLSGAAILLVRWWLPGTELFESVRGYDATGIVNLGWTVFAVGVVLAVGTLWRRPLMTLILTGIVYFVARIAFISGGLRARLLPTERLEEPLPGVGDLGDRAWVTSSWFGRPDGSRVLDQDFYDFCQRQPLDQCLQQNGLTTRGWEYHPGSQYWPMQFIETGILAVIGTVLIGWTVWYWLRRLE